MALKLTIEALRKLFPGIPLKSASPQAAADIRALRGELHSNREQTTLPRCTWAAIGEQRSGDDDAEDP